MLCLLSPPGLHFILSHSGGLGLRVSFHSLATPSQVARFAGLPPASVLSPTSWAQIKLGVGQREPAANKEELRMQIVEHMEETKSNPEKVKNFFRKATVRYASNNHVLLPEQ